MIGRHVLKLKDRGVDVEIMRSRESCFFFFSFLLFLVHRNINTMQRVDPFSTIYFFYV